MTTPIRTLWYALGALLDPAEVCCGRAPVVRDQDWPRLCHLAADQLVAPALYAVLAARGRLAQVPGQVRDPLAMVHALNDARNRRLRSVLHETAQILNRAGIVPMPLKGAIALLPDQYPHAFARMMHDLDLAVAPSETARAADALRTAGYYCAPQCDPTRWPADACHLVPLFHPSGAGYVEIHHALFGARVPTAALSLPLLQARALARDWDGVAVRIPTLEHRLLHNALHHQLDDKAFALNRRSVRQLLEFAQLRALPMADALDWPGLLGHLDGVGAGDALRGYLLAARDLFDQPLPAGVRPTRAALRAERRFAFERDHPRWHRWQQGLTRYRHRLTQLPRRLLTPAWYPAKYRSLRQRWFTP